MDFLNWLFAIPTAYLPPLHLALNIETPVEKLTFLIVGNIFAVWVIAKVGVPLLKFVWSVLAGLVCAVSLQALTVYAAYKFKRLNKMRWHMMIPFLLSRWADFTFTGYKNTTITSPYFIWKGPFNWVLVAQSFVAEPTTVPVPDDDDYVHLSPEQMRESNARDEAELNESCFDKHPETGAPRYKGK